MTKPRPRSLFARAKADFIHAIFAAFRELRIGCLAVDRHRALAEALALGIERRADLREGFERIYLLRLQWPAIGPIVIAGRQHEGMANALERLQNRFVV